jgi:uncharacterized protein YndB with AHSA1/START domain
MRLRHRVRTSATPAQVWQVLGQPSRWPEFDVVLRHVAGSPGRAVAGQHLLGTGRGIAVRIPIDVLEAEPERRLVMRTSAVPGVVQEVTYEITPVVRGGCHVTVSVVVEGLFARPAVAPLWLGSGVTARVLARRVERLARAARKAA